MIWFEDFEPGEIMKKEKPTYKNHIAYDTNIITLDTETTNIFLKEKNVFSFDYKKNSKFYEDAEKISFVYIWQMSINGTTVYGRNLNQLSEFFKYLDIYSNGMMIIWIHNLPFEFQFLRNIITDFTVFARKSRHPITARTEEYNIEFRDSLILSGYSLAKCAEVYNTEHKKLTGDLDYLKLRTCDTKLSKQELSYCENDVIVLYEIIKYFLNQYGTLTKIPLTQTGRVRKEVKKIYCKNKKYKERVRRMISKDAKEFTLLHHAFSGGYTHSNGLRTDEIIKDVYSYDITSSYPTVMLCEKYPMSSFFLTEKYKKYDVKQDGYIYIYDVTFKNLRQKKSMVFLSQSKAIMCYDIVNENGRIKKAGIAQFILPESDLNIVFQDYDFDEIIYNNTYCAVSDYLDIDYINYILKLYEEKTILKGCDPEQYMKSKQFLNSLYGMMVTNIINDEVDFSEEWTIKPLNESMINESLEKMKKSNNNIFNFGWGIFVTAYARRNLWDLILKVDRDCIYSDTDSIKFTGDKNFKYFNDYNKKIVRKLQKVFAERGINFEKTRPKDLKGVRHQIGVYDYEGKYDFFKTLGAKKYCFEKDGKTGITVSGVNKTSGLKKIKSCKDFNIETVFDYEESGRLIATYNDNQSEFSINGKKIYYKYGVNLMPTTYKLNMTPDYMDIIRNYNDKQYERSDYFEKH